MSIQIINQPTVSIISRPAVDKAALESFLRFYGYTYPEPFEQGSKHAWFNAAGELLCENAGRLCYLSYNSPRPGGTSAYFDRIKGEAHGSILEHANYTFLIGGVSRSLTHELVRHRAGFAFSQLSQRYVAENECRFVRPIDIEIGSPEYDLWAESCAASQEKYIQMVVGLNEKFQKGEIDKTAARKKARGAARSVLPNCTETLIQVTANIRAIRHFLFMRGSTGAEAEIRRLANCIHSKMVHEEPSIFSDMERGESLPDGTYTIVTKYPKV